MKRYTPKEKAEYVKSRNKELKSKIYQFAQELAEETDKAKFNKKFIEFIEFSKKFWRYSLGNKILISIQKPNASYVAGFRKWKELGRFVKKGEKGIWILCPTFYPKKEKVIFTNEKGEQEEKEISVNDCDFVTGYIGVSVFDVSQTEGDKIPTLEYAINTNKHPELLKKAEMVLAENNITLIYRKMEKTTFGLTDGKTITVNSEISTDDKLHTILHERLHYIKHFNEDRQKYTKKQKETEAEATSYIVCRLLDITPSKSYNYLALYNSDSKFILDSLNRIDRAIKELFKELEIKPTELKPQKKEKEIEVTAR